MKYRVVLKGENFEIVTENKVTNMGFYTTRFVNAESLDEAEMKAIELIKNDEYLLKSVVPNSSVEPMIYVEAIYQAKWWNRVGGKGFTFWDMGNE